MKKVDKKKVKHTPSKVTPAGPAPDYLVVFGAAVKENGQASGSLRRRVDGALQNSKALENPIFILTGGKGKHGKAEALVMADILATHGVASETIILEDQSKDTLESIIRCSAILQEQHTNIKSITVCSSSYHNYRCQVLFWLNGFKCRRAKMPSDRNALGIKKWLFYYLRETIATPWDMFLLVLKRVFN